MTDQPAKEPRVHGITESDFQSWRHNPVSKVVLQYLSDKRAFVERSVIDQWIAGSMSLMADQSLRGQIIELIEMHQLPFEAIFNFYSKEDDGTEANQDPTR